MSPGIVHEPWPDESTPSGGHALTPEDVERIERRMADARVCTDACQCDGLGCYAPEGMPSPYEVLALCRALREARRERDERFEEGTRLVNHLHDADATYRAALADKDRLLVECETQRQRAEAEVKALRAALERLELAAGAYCADQADAPDQRCGLVQPVTVAEAEELNAALVEAAERLAASPPTGQATEGT